MLHVEQSAARPEVAALPFTIGGADREQFDALPDAVREEVLLLLGIFKLAARSKCKSRIFKSQAAGLSIARRGFSVDSLQRKWASYQNSGGDWRVLVNGAKVPAERSLPRDFVEFIQGWFAKNKRVALSQYRKFVRFWEQGCDDKGNKFSVPGYGTWMDWWTSQRPGMEFAVCPGLPPGWSYANLMRARYRLTKAQETMAREGTTAARAFTPHILGTRAGLRFLEEVTFDDVKTDFRIIDAGDVLDLWLLVAFDRATACCLGYGMRPARVREDGTQEHLKLIDMKQLAGWVLERWGLPPYPITWKLENGCATFPEATAIALKDLSSGAINVSYARMLNGTSAAGYRERALGNSRSKASHEAHNNLLHNMAGDLPGQTGRRWDVRPADLASREKEARDIWVYGKTGTIKELAVAQRLTPERRQGMRAPILTVAQAREELNRIFDQMNARTAHELEGFEEIAEWRPNQFSGWQSIASFQDLPGYETRTRMESPYERMRRLVAGLQDQWRRVARSTLVHFYQETQRVVAVNDRVEIAFVHEKRDLVFMAPMQAGGPAGLQAGDKFLAYFHPGEPDFLHLTRLPPHSGYVATWVRRERVRNGDAAALQAAFSYTEGALAAQRAHLDRVCSGERKERGAMHEHNQRLIEEQAADMNAVAPLPHADRTTAAASAPSAVAAALDAAREQIARSQYNEAARERKEQALADLADAAFTKKRTEE